MQYIHIKNLEKYHPGYKDRILLWAKIHIKMIQGDPDCEMITNETDWARLIKFILLELNAQKPLPLDPRYLQRKGFDLKGRPIELTLKMLHNFIDIVSTTDTECIQDVTHIRVDKNRVDKNRVDKDSLFQDIVTDLNSILNTNYKQTTPKTRELISARLKDGFTLEDFKIVHRKMSKAWGVDNKMRQYLRPQTLYSTKFESYLNRPDDLKVGSAGAKTALAAEEWLKEKKKNAK